MSCFPFFMEIRGKECLVVGGGRVALRKIEKLRPFGIHITAISPLFCMELEEMTDILRIQRHFQPVDAEGKLFVIAAADDAEVNEEIASLCRERNIPVNVVDAPEQCTFFFPALVKRGELVVGISTGGNSPLAARYIREKTEDVIPMGFERVLEVLSSVRGQVKAEISDSKKRERIFQEIFLLAMERAEGVTEAEIQEIIRREGEKHG